MLISPFQRHGSVVRYLEIHPSRDEVQPRLLRGALPSPVYLMNSQIRSQTQTGIMSGLDYLHNQVRIAHGDLKGVRISQHRRWSGADRCCDAMHQNNVLVDDTGSAILADFGQAKILDNSDYSRSLQASARWTAPELLFPETLVEKPAVHPPCDIWAFAMVVIEVCSVRSVDKSLV